MPRPDMLSLKMEDAFKYILNSFDKSPSNITAIVGMSGGVDSSVTAALMHRAGFKVIGVTLQLSQAEKKIRSCCSEKDIQDAASVASHMGFPHYVLDYSKNFKEQVVDDFISEYNSGSTPSPCVRCNQKIKFGDLLDFATKLKADTVITGHYIKHKYSSGKTTFHRPKDMSKDQTYFMSLVRREVMDMVRFPLGIYTKTEVRQIAKDLDLIVATKSDSQDLCFVQSGSYREILQQLSIKTGKGMIVDLNNNILGSHDGIQNYTVGQRKGLNLPNGPWFVLKIIAEENKVIIGKQSDLERTTFIIDKLNLMVDHLPRELLAQVRARANPVPCKIEDNRVILSEPVTSVAPGQICAFYSGDLLVGGAKILSEH